MNTPVNFELAKLLKEKGFDVPIEHYYNAEGIWEPNPKWDRKLRRNKNGKKENFLDYEDCISAPTITEAVMWLYEKHGIWVNIGFSGDESCYLMVTNKIGEIKWNEKGFKSPTEAYEAAIEYTLKNLIL